MKRERIKKGKRKQPKGCAKIKREKGGVSANQSVSERADNAPNIGRCFLLFIILTDHLFWNIAIVKQ